MSVNEQAAVRTGGGPGARVCIVVLVLLGLGAGLAAAGQEPPAPTDRRGSRQPGELIVFVQPDRREGSPITLRLASLEAITVDGESFPLGEGPFLLRSDQGVGTGAQVARTGLPSGPYRGLRCAPEGVAGGTPPAPFDVEVPFRIVPDTATSVFLSWNPAAAPSAISGRVEQPQLRSLLMFVTNSGGDDVTVIQRDREQVAGVVKVGREPLGIASDALGGRVYVAVAGADLVSVIDTQSRTVLDEIRMRFGSRPVDVAVSGSSLYVVAAERATLVVYSTSSLQERAEVEVGRRPARVVASPDGSSILVTNESSNTVSVIGATSLRVEATVPVESRPREIVVDPISGRAFVGHLGSEAVVVLGFNRTVERILHFGGAVTGMALDEQGRRLYLAVGSLGRLLFAQSGSETVTGFVPLPGPGRMVLDPDGKKIYVLDPEGNRVQIVNRVLVRAQGSIPTGARPHDLVLLP